jgi:hypothetical protein
MASWTVVGIESESSPNQVGIESELSRNRVRIESESSRNRVGIESESSRNRVVIESESSRNGVGIESESSRNCCHFLSCLHKVSYACETACGTLSLLPCKLSEHNLPLLPSLWFEWCLSTCLISLALPAPPFLLIGVPSGLNLRQSWVLCDLYCPPCFLHRVHCLSLKSTCLDILGMQEAIDSILHLPSVPFG